jgi:hypothetical protein
MITLVAEVNKKNKINTHFIDFVPIFMDFYLLYLEITNEKCIFVAN